ncbi:hypothetical protein BDR26DRAFT_455581 [Obelidium mucronatum]|nr:hypothetical protein BDR26DRAFT_455581 [Obelidium mucronatum]
MTTKLQRILHQMLLRVPFALLLLLILLGFLGPYYVPQLFIAYYVFCNAFLLISTLRSVCGAISVAILSRRPVVVKVNEGSAKHLLVIPNYKEDIDTLRDTLSVLASHIQAREEYQVTLAMEESEEGSADKAISLCSEYANAFASIGYSVHPKNLKGEARGKSSNVCYAAKQIASSLPQESKRTSIFTIMDADSCLSSDYFESVKQKHLSTNDQCQLFVPFSVFDRNSDTVSPFVRMMDVSWSFAHMSFFIPGYMWCPGLSAYSVPFMLMEAVGFWDVGPDSIAEDTRTTLKLVFATSYRLRMTQIYSPVSQCNIVGSTDSWTSGLYARSVQLKRHNWGGNLEFAYALRMGISRLFGLETPENMRLKTDNTILFGSTPNSLISNVGASVMRFLRACVVFFHMFELTIWSVHALVVNLFSFAFIPKIGPSFLWPLADAYWAALGGGPVDPKLANTGLAMGWVQLSVLGLVVLLAIAYETQYHWNAIKKWNAYNKEEMPIEDQMESNVKLMDGKPIPLGDRSAIVAGPRKWHHYVEWVLFIPVAVYFVGMLIYVAIGQVLWDRLDYVVAAKPSVGSAGGVSNVLHMRDEGLPEIPGSTKRSSPTRQTVKNIDSGIELGGEFVKAN